MVEDSDRVAAVHVGSGGRISRMHTLNDPGSRQKQRGRACGHNCQCDRRLLGCALLEKIQTTISANTLVITRQKISIPDARLGHPGKEPKTVVFESSEYESEPCEITWIHPGYPEELSSVSIKAVWDLAFGPEKKTAL